MESPKSGNWNSLVSFGSSDAGIAIMPRFTSGLIWRIGSSAQRPLIIMAASPFAIMAQAPL